MYGGLVQSFVLVATESPGVGPGELLDYLPLLYRAAWFFGTVLGITALGWFVLEPAVSELVRRRNQNNPTIRDVITRYVRLLVLLVALLVGLAAGGFGYIIGDSLLVIAAGTLAVGVAGQTVLGSLVSGVVLVMDPEFNVGDYVEWSEGNGRIQSITLRVTRVVTPTGELITVPNTTLTNEAVVRPYGLPRHRLDHEVGLAYDADLSAALEHLDAATAEVDDIANEPSPRVFVDEFDPDWVTCQVHYWIAEPEHSDVFEVRSAYARAAKARLESAGFTVSPPSKRDLEGEVAVLEPADG